MRTRGSWLGSLLLIAGSAAADSWMPAQTEAYRSANGVWRLTVHPRDLSGNLDYFEDRVAQRPQPGGLPGDAQTSAIGHMERQINGRWRTVWKAPLKNDVAPVSVVVADEGHAVTFDNWHAMGYGPHAVVIYGPGGELVRAMALPDFLPQPYFRALPRSISSIDWRREPRISEDGTQVIVPVTIPGASDNGQREQRYVDIHFDLLDGQRTSTTETEPAWLAAVAESERAFARVQAYERAEYERFVSPLAAPGTGESSGAWHRYLSEAYRRLAYTDDDAYPSVRVVEPPDHEGQEAVLERLGGTSVDDGPIVIGAASQTWLLDAITRRMAGVEPGALTHLRIYVAVDQAHLAAIRHALAPTGATFLPIDIDQPIPQQPDRLKKYLKNREDAERAALSGD